MSYYLHQIKRKLILLEYGDKPKLLRGLVEINCRKTGTGESLAGIAEYTCVIILFTFTFENWNKPPLNTISFIIE